MPEKIYQAPGPFTEPKPPAEPKEYTAADQARAFGVPEEDLKPDAEDKTKAPPSGLPKAFWRSLGIGN